MRGTKKNKVLMVILYVALTLVIASVCFAFVKIGKIEKTKDIKSSSYTIGALNAEDGKEVKDEHALRTGYFDADKFNKITIKDKADVTYQIFYFDENKAFIGKTEALSADTTEIAKTQTVQSASKNVKYYRVVISLKDASKKVNWFNKASYVKQVTLTVNK